MSQMNWTLNVSLVTARRYTMRTSTPWEFTSLTPVVVNHSTCTAIWTVSGRSSRGDWMALLTSTATGPAMLMALVTLTVNTGWVWRTFIASLRGQHPPSSECPSLILREWRSLPLTVSFLLATLPPTIASMLLAMEALQVMACHDPMVHGVILAMPMQLTGVGSRVITTPSSTLTWRSEQFEEQSIKYREL